MPGSIRLAEHVQRAEHRGGRDESVGDDGDAVCRGGARRAGHRRQLQPAEATEQLFAASESIRARRGAVEPLDRRRLCLRAKALPSTPVPRPDRHRRRFAGERAENRRRRRRIADAHLAQAERVHSVGRGAIGRGRSDGDARR